MPMRLRVRLLFEQDGLLVVRPRRAVAGKIVKAIGSYQYGMRPRYEGSCKSNTFRAG